MSDAFSSDRRKNKGKRMLGRGGGPEGREKRNAGEGGVKEELLKSVCERR